MLRDYQFLLANDIYAAWGRGARGVLATMATGGGKTVVFADILRSYQAPAVLIAHRGELVSQSALALNRERVPHSIVGPKSLVREIIRLEHDTHGYSSFAWRASIRVAGVDTLVRHDVDTSVGLVVIDEGHHALRENKWGRCAALFPNARVLGVTAHAVRADGAGLGAHADGIYDALVIGPHARALIDRGYLTDYSMRIPPTDIAFDDVPIGSTGDYSAPQLRAATHQSKRLVGDVVQHYLRYAGGKLGLTFAVDIEAANELCVAYRNAGVPAEVVSGETPIAARAAIMRQFRSRALLQLVSVDVLGEGTDVPAVEVVSLARRTASWQLLCQQIGRALRVSVDVAEWGALTDDERRAHIAASAKPRALILDHVGNLLYHHARRGFPDEPQQYTLDRAERRSRTARDGAIPIRNCLECFQPYERHHPACPYCGAEHVPSARSAPEHVDGDLVALDPTALRTLQRDIARVDGPPRLPTNVLAHVQKHIKDMHLDRQRGQATLRAVMAVWGGYWRLQGHTDRQIQRRFWFTFGVDVMTAQTLGLTESLKLETLIRAELTRLNVREAA